MATTSEIRVAVSTEAEDRVRELGMQREFEAMLEHTRLTVAGLRAIEVSTFFDELGQMRLLITARKDSRAPVDYDPTRWDWDAWLVRAFAPEVVQWFGFFVDYETCHAG